MRASVKTCTGKREKGVSLDEWSVKEVFFLCETPIMKPQTIKFPTVFD